MPRNRGTAKEHGGARLSQGPKALPGLRAISHARFNIRPVSAPSRSLICHPSRSDPTIELGSAAHRHFIPWVGDINMLCENLFVVREPRPTALSPIRRCAVSPFRLLPSAVNLRFRA
jgi:hypothetical protein